jgi:hypothetical protein
VAGATRPLLRVAGRQATVVLLGETSQNVGNTGYFYDLRKFKKFCTEYWASADLKSPARLFVPW